MESLRTLEIAITIFFQNLGGWLVPPMRFFTFLGQEEFFLLIMPAIYWCVNAVLGLRVGVMLMMANAVNFSFKLVSRGPRPFWIEPRVRAYLHEFTFGLPSGHAETAASVWGLLAVSVRKRWLKTLLLLTIFFIGLSRIILGVHFTSDVLAGWLLGGLTILIFIKLEKPLWNWLKQMPLGQQYIVLFLLSLLVVTISLLPLLWMGGYQMPAEWLQNALNAFPDQTANPIDPSGAFTVGGTLFGMAAGAAWLFQRRGGLNVSGSLQQRILRYIFGFAGMILIYAGLGSIFPRDPNLLSYALRFLRYALIGLWVSAFAPVLFVQFGLAEPVSEQFRFEMQEKRI